MGPVKSIEVNSHSYCYKFQRISILTHNHQKDSGDDIHVVREARVKLIRRHFSMTDRVSIPSAICTVHVIPITRGMNYLVLLTDHL